VNVDTNNNNIITVSLSLEIYVVCGLTCANIYPIWYSLNNISIITEDMISPRGSCCDDGRFVFSSCDNWWYRCPDYGLHNYSSWIRFGHSGFSMPQGTEHQAKCKYSKKRISCPKPATCSNIIPRESKEICEEMPFVVKV